MKHQKILVKEDLLDERLDVYLVGRTEKNISRSHLKKLIDGGAIHVNGRKVAPHYAVKPGDQIDIEWLEAEPEGNRPENIPLDILYEDEEVIAVNKPAGMVVHPANGNWHHTLVNALLFHTKHLSGAGGEERPGIVHRLDKDTSGVLIIAKNNAAHRDLARQFKEHTIGRIYHALVRGIVQHDEGYCEEPVGRAFINKKKIMIKPSGGKDAATDYKVLRRFKQATLLEVSPRTGRTHQIRVHMQHIGHPVLGDTLYGIASPLISRQALHAAELTICHPKTGENMTFSSPLPKDMQRLIEQLESQP